MIDHSYYLREVWGMKIKAFNVYISKFCRNVGKKIRQDALDNLSVEFIKVCFFDFLQFNSMGNFL